VLFADAIVSALTAVLMLTESASLTAWLGVPAALLTTAASGTSLYAAYLVWAGTRKTLPRAAVWLPVLLNIVWAADCLALALGVGGQPGTLGQALLAVQVIGALVFAELEYAGLRRATAAAA
jgi:hypothetical protein